MGEELNLKAKIIAKVREIDDDELLKNVANTIEEGERDKIIQRLIESETCLKKSSCSDRYFLRFMSTEGLKELLKDPKKFFKGRL
jgi:hypothetical protein